MEKLETPEEKLEKVTSNVDKLSDAFKLIIKELHNISQELNTLNKTLRRK